MKIFNFARWLMLATSEIEITFGKNENMVGEIIIVEKSAN